MSTTIILRKKALVAAFVQSEGSISLSGDLIAANIPTSGLGVVLNSAAGGLSLSGEVTPQVGGPSNTILTAALAGSVTPAGAVARANIGGSVDVSTELIGGLIAPIGVVTPVIDPATMVIQKSIGGELGITGSPSQNIVSTGTTLLQGIAGTITPAGAVATVAGGPTIVTTLKSVVGTITPAGSVTNVTVAPPAGFLSKALAATITPAGTVVGIVSGPSIETKSKVLSSSIPMAGAVTTLAGGPSLVTIPKGLTSMITPVGTVTTQVTGPSHQTITKSVSGSITPVGSRTSTVIPGTPGTNVVIRGGLSSLPSSLWNNSSPFWRSLVLAGRPTPSGFIAQCAQWRALGWRVWVALSGPRSSWTNSNGDFNFNAWKALVDQFVPFTAAMQTYIDDGTIMHYIVDEPQINVFNGTIPPNVVKQMCQYSKSLWPNLKTGVRASARFLTNTSQTTPPDGLPTGGWAGSLDYAWAQYEGPLHVPSGGETPMQFYTREKAQLLAGGIPHVVLANNWIDGGDSSSGQHGNDPTILSRWVQTPTEIKATYSAAVTFLTEDFYMAWSYPYQQIGEPFISLYNSAPYQAAFAFGNNLLNSRTTSTPPPPDPPVFYTDPGVHAPPFPPPVVAVGGALEDPLTSHKVFHLLDDARTDNAEYPAINSDNSRIYFVRGGAGMLGEVIWNIASSTVQVGNIRSAFDSTFPGMINTVIWDRNDKRFLYYLSFASTKIYRKDTDTNQTTLLKDLSSDPSFASFWSSRGQTPATMTSAGMHASRAQERFVSTVRPLGGVGIGIFVWDRLTAQVWNWAAPAGRTVNRVTIDSIGQYVKIHYSDNTWLTLTLNSQGTYVESTVLSAVDPPLRDDSLSNKMWQSSGEGIKSWPFNPVIPNGTLVYAHPKKSSKVDVFSKGRVSVQAEDQIIYEFVAFGGVLCTAWTLNSGEVYKLDWAREQGAQPDKLVPEVVRQGTTQLTSVASLAALTARGQWFYDATAKMLYVRTTTGGNPAPLRIVAFDWRFGMEEIIMVNVAGTLKGRLCHHFSFVGDIVTDADAFRGGSVSYDGSRVVFTSNWGGKSTNGIYAVLTDPRL